MIKRYIAAILSYFLPFVKNIIGEIYCFFAVTEKKGNDKKQ
jgi:hypothetical protein